MKRLIKRIALLGIMLFAAYWLVSFLHCEMLTVEHSEEFSDAWKEHTMIASVDYCKVIEYTDTYAEVYYVTESAYGNVLTFTRDSNNGDWNFYEWHTVWSSTGSAEDFIWPYIR